jgi:tetratricopeptide (TPR) repeat protein
MKGCTREEGNAALGAGEHGEAVRIYSRALGAAPRDERLLSNRSLAYYRLGDLAPALADAEAVIACSPGWDKGYLRKGLTLDRMGGRDRDVLAAYEQGALAVPGSLELARAALGVRERLGLMGEPVGAARAPAVAARGGASDGGARVTWDEAGLARDARERGVLYARMRIDQPDTPFLVYDADKGKQGLIGTVAHNDAPVVYVDMDELRSKLGLLETAQQGGDSVKAPPSEGAGRTDFEARRLDVYRDEASAFTKGSKQ